MDDLNEEDVFLDESDFDDRDTYQFNDIGPALRFKGLRDFAET